jgi:hypothetical protein
LVAAEVAFLRLGAADLASCIIGLPGDGTFGATVEPEYSRQETNARIMCCSGTLYTHNPASRQWVALNPGS